jgi:hypothetical protein
MEIKINTKSIRKDNQGPSFMVQLDNQEPKELVMVEILHVISEIFLNDVVPSYVQYKSPVDWSGITEYLMKDNPLDLTDCDPDAVSDAVDELEFNLSKSDEENFHAVKVRSPKNMLRELPSTDFKIIGKYVKEWAEVEAYYNADHGWCHSSFLEVRGAKFRVRFLDDAYINISKIRIPQDQEPNEWAAKWFDFDKWDEGQLAIYKRQQEGDNPFLSKEAKIEANKKLWNDQGQPWERLKELIFDHSDKGKEYTGPFILNLKIGAKARLLRISDNDSRLNVIGSFWEKEDCTPTDETFLNLQDWLKPEKFCNDCIHWGGEDQDFQCRLAKHGDCDSKFKKNWQPKEEKRSCETCNLQGTDCPSCYAISDEHELYKFWQPKEEKRSCESCDVSTLSYSKVCDTCDENYSNWQPKQQETE